MTTPQPAGELATIVSDTTRWNEASRKALGKYGAVADALHTAVAPLFKEVAIDTSDPVFQGDTPMGFLQLINDKIDRTCVGLQRGLDELHASLQDALPATILSSLIVAGAARSMRLTIKLTEPTRGEAAWGEEFILSKAVGSGARSALGTGVAYTITCTTERPPIFWSLYTRSLGFENPQNAPFNLVVPGLVVDGLDENLSIRRRAGVLPKICSDTRESFMADELRYSYRITDPATVDKLISTVVNTRPFRAAVYSTPRAGAAGLLMTACGTGDGKVNFVGGRAA